MKKIASIVLLFLLLFITITSNIAAVNTSINGQSDLIYKNSFEEIVVFPVESSFDAIQTDNSIYRPNFFHSYVDSVFQTKVTRFTDKIIYEDFGAQTGYQEYHPVIEYPKRQSWNSDGSLIRIQHTLIDGNTYEIIKDITGNMYERKWSHSNPDILYGISNGATDFWFSRQDVSQPNTPITQLYPFPRSLYEVVFIGPFEGNISNDDKYVAITAKKISDSKLHVFIYDIQQNIVTAEEDFDILWSDLDWVSITPNGRYVLINWTADPSNPDVDSRRQVHQYDINLNPLRVPLATKGNHGDIGLNAFNEEVYVQFEFGNDKGIWLYNLEDGLSLRLLPDKYNGGHVSCKNINRPGWCYLSTKKDGFQEVFALKLDGSGIVNRFAQTHSSGETFGAPNRNGDRVLFKSDWNGISRFDSFFVELNLATLDDTLSSPANFLANGDDNSVNLSWDTVVNATSYKICFSQNTIVNPLACETFKEKINATTTVIEGLSNGKTYYFQIMSENSLGNLSPASPEITAIPQTSNHVFTFAGHSYELVKSPVTWNDASRVAQQKSLLGYPGHLLNIASDPENIEIAAQLAANISVAEQNNTTANDGGGVPYVWIAANDRRSEGNWIWEDSGEQFWQGTHGGTVQNGLYNNWGNVLEPDDFSNAQDAGAMALGNWPGGVIAEWNDVNELNDLFYLIEYDVVD